MLGEHSVQSLAQLDFELMLLTGTGSVPSSQVIWAVVLIFCKASQFDHLLINTSLHIRRACTIWVHASRVY
jgi:hypothetical protein